MNRYTSSLILLAILAPVTAEICNGSTRLSNALSLHFFIGTFTPYACLILILTYLVQKTQSRAGMLFLLPIPGLVIEGLLVKSFFDTSFWQLSDLRDVGMWAGVQWTWAFSLIASHLFVSFLIPLSLATIYSGTKTLQVSRHVAAIASSVLLFIIGWFSLANVHEFSWYWLKLALTAVTILVCIYLSRIVKTDNKNKRSISAPFFFVIGFFFPIANWLSSFFIAHQPVSIICIAQITLYSVYGYFIWSQWFNENTTDQKYLSFIAGYFAPYSIGFIFAGFIYEYSDILLVGCTLALLIVSFLVKQKLYSLNIHSIMME